MAAPPRALAAALPDALRRFLQDNGVDPAVYEAAATLPRYVRVNPRRPIAAEALSAQLGCEVRAAALPGFLRLSGDAKIVQCDAYRKGQVYGLDLSSGAAVVALGLQDGDRVLDLCCAPGGKLCMIADTLRALGGGGGFVVGVDASLERLRVCRNLLLKYGVENAQLRLADGASFNELAPSAPPPPFSGEIMGARERRGRRFLRAQARRKSKRAREDAAVAAAASGWDPERDGKRGRTDKEAAGRDGEEKDAEEVAVTEEEKAKEKGAAAGPQDERLQKRPPDSGPVENAAQMRDALFDKVLVDADCTHDGSVRHVAKYEGQWGWDTLDSRLLNPTRLAALEALQRSLLRNGFRLLRPGGTLVYSTCSFCRAQNEDVVAALLAAERHAELLELPDALQALRVQPGLVPRTFRMDPSSSETSGFFLARVRKRAP